MQTVKTEAAFGRFREAFGPARAPDASRIRNQDELIQLLPDDGLVAWVDGDADKGSVAQQPSISTADPVQLWVVRAEDVVYAGEQCQFGQGLETGSLKHTNLTGGGDAYAGGELLVLPDGVLVVNGRSGRYPIRSAVDFFPIPSTPITRRGRFAYVACRAFVEGLITADTAASILNAEEKSVSAHAKSIIDLIG